MAELKHNQYVGYDWTKNRPDDWMDEAACVGNAPLFMVKDHRGGDPVSNLKWKNYEKEKFQEAIKICRSCPVQQECGEDSTLDDFKWTVRAARMPSAFSTRPAGRPLKSEAEKRDPDTCINGHVGHYKVLKSGSRACSECSRERNRNARKRKGAFIRGTADTCRNGHTGFYRMEKSGRRCQKCRAEQHLREHSAKVKA